MNPLCRTGVILKKARGLVIIVVLAAGCDLLWARETGQQPVREQASGKPLTTCPQRQMRAKFSQTFPCSYFFCCAHCLPRCIYSSFFLLHSFLSLFFSASMTEMSSLMYYCTIMTIFFYVAWVVKWCLHSREKYINCGYLACEFNAEVWTALRHGFSCSRHETGWALDEQWSVARWEAGGLSLNWIRCCQAVMAHGSVRATQTHFGGNWRTFLFNLTCSFVDFILRYTVQV